MALLDLCKKRRAFLDKLWSKEESTLRFKTYPKKSDRYDEHQKLIQALDSEFYAEAKEAVMEKWLTLCKH